MLSAVNLEKLRCTTCHCYLSVFPIRSYEGERPVCGRCPVQEEFCPRREPLYETMADVLLFPCQYEVRGCLERLTPKDMQVHELTCPYKPFLCPYLPIGECDYQGDLETMYEHFQQEHPGFIFRDVELDIIRNYVCNYLYQDENGLFIVQLRCDVNNDVLYVQVKHAEGRSLANKFSFGLSFSTRVKGTVSNVVGSVTFGDTRGIDVEKASVVQIDELKQNLNNPTCIITAINITANNPAVENDISKFEEDVLRHIECPVCFMYMIPPILQCMKGHSFCKTCHDTVKECPLCKSEMACSQNFILEAFTDSLKYPCKYRDYDCGYTSNALSIRQHEESCVHGPLSCIFEDCNWENKLTKMMSHIRESHHDEFLDVNTVTYHLEPRENETRVYALYRFGNIFKLVFCVNDFDFKWTVQLVGPDTDNTKYMFEFDIKGPNGERIHYKKLCCANTKMRFAFNNPDEYIALQQDAFNHMIQDDMITYNCNIVEIWNNL